MKTNLHLLKALQGPIHEELVNFVICIFISFKKKNIVLIYKSIHIEQKYVPSTIKPSTDVLGAVASAGRVERRARRWS